MSEVSSEHQYQAKVPGNVTLGGRSPKSVRRRAIDLRRPQLRLARRSIEDQTGSDRALPLDIQHRLLSRLPESLTHISLIFPRDNI